MRGRLKKQEAGILSKIQRRLIGSIIIPGSRCGSKAVCSAA